MFAANDIAGDVHAKQKDGIIITRLIADAITSGSAARLASEFESLEKITSGPASSLERFVQKATGTPTEPELNGSRDGTSVEESVDSD